MLQTFLLLPPTPNYLTKDFGARPDEGMGPRNFVFVVNPNPNPALIK